MITQFKSNFSNMFQPPVFRLKRLTLEDTGADANLLVDRMKKTELFCNARPALIRAMLDLMTVRRVKQGDILLKQGGRGDSVTLLAAGQVQIAHAREGNRTARQLAVLTEPAALGEESLMGAEIRSVTATMLTDGYILKIRRVDFARLVSTQGVAWMSLDNALQMQKPQAEWLWAGALKTRPRGITEVLTVELERLRGWLSELDPAVHYLCCSRDDGNSALAAFLLTQRGFMASAVRDGQRLGAAIKPHGDKRPEA